jgi:hypothetical protein
MIAAGVRDILGIMNLTTEVLVALSAVIAIALLGGLAAR